VRDRACASWVGLAEEEESFVFLTGDLGFQALEPLRDKLGARFINAGVAEQNMVSVAAGLAAEGLACWVYSIAPFCYARPYEQIRNDVCQHGLPVRLVGNGGGYAYGAMGATHHALEDYGALLALPGMRAIIPAFREDVDVAVQQTAKCSGPVYLRLGRCEAPPGWVPPAFAAWRRLVVGDAGVLIAVGPLAGPLVAALHARPERARPSLWALGELPIVAGDLPRALVADIERSAALVVAEEHVATGGAGEALARRLLESGVRVGRFEHVAARGYPSGGYGSQAWHRRECGLDAESLLARVEALRSRAA
jgi:transketolase